VDDPAVAETALEYGAFGYLIKPFERNTVLITVANALRRRELEIEHVGYQRALERTVLAQTEELRLSREEGIQRLARAADLREGNSGEHNRRVGLYCALIGERVGMSVEQCEQLRLAGVLHDVGKIGVSDRVLLKPGELDDEEYTEVKGHAEMGHRILSGSSSPLLELAATVALTHHEKYDGSGYPRGLSGAAIPIEGRIAAVADVFDALTSKRVYRDAWSLEQATDMLARERSAHFDPKHVDLFLGSMDEVLRIRRRHPDQGAELTRRPPWA
jgi:putative two-component system response regulator